MTTIYEQHDKAFNQVGAFVILKDGERVATIAFKFPKDGAGRLYAYVHWIGLEMARGHANGYGYDKASAAVENAIHITNKQGHKWPKHGTPDKALLDNFIKALGNIGGNTWDRALQDAGFTVLQAV